MNNEVGILWAVQAQRGLMGDAHVLILGREKLKVSSAASLLRVLVKVLGTWAGVREEFPLIRASKTQRSKRVI